MFPLFAGDPMKPTPGHPDPTLRTTGSGAPSFCGTGVHFQKQNIIILACKLKHAFKTASPTSSI